MQPPYNNGNPLYHQQFNRQQQQPPQQPQPQPPHYGYYYHHHNHHPASAPQPQPTAYFPNMAMTVPLQQPPQQQQSQQIQAPPQLPSQQPQQQPQQQQQQQQEQSSQLLDYEILPNPRQLEEEEEERESEQQQQQFQEEEEEESSDTKHLIRPVQATVPVSQPQSSLPPVQQQQPPPSYVYPPPQQPQPQSQSQQQQQPPVPAQLQQPRFWPPRSAAPNQPASVPVVGYPVPTANHPHFHPPHPHFHPHPPHPHCHRHRHCRRRHYHDGHPHCHRRRHFMRQGLSFKSLLIAQLCVSVVFAFLMRSWLPLIFVAMFSFGILAAFIQNVPGLILFSVGNGFSVLGSSWLLLMVIGAMITQGYNTGFIVALLISSGICLVQWASFMTGLHYTIRVAKRKWAYDPNARFHQQQQQQQQPPQFLQQPQFQQPQFQQPQFQQPQYPQQFQPQQQPQQQQHVPVAVAMPNTADVQYFPVQ